MKEYIARRLAYSLLTLFAIATLLFIMFRMMPGDPTAQVISPALDAVAQQRMREAFGLDQPVFMQYLLYLKNVVTLEWGRSFTTSERVFDILVYRFWNTMLLMVAGLLLTFVIGVATGRADGHGAAASSISAPPSMSLVPRRHLHHRHLLLDRAGFRQLRLDLFPAA
ncbi:MAG: ABC transporter permease [Burkholderiaceae bacterium]